MATLYTLFDSDIFNRRILLQISWNLLQWTLFSGPSSSSFWPLLVFWSLPSQLSIKIILYLCQVYDLVHTFSVVSLSSSMRHAFLISLTFFKFSLRISSLLLKFFFASKTVSFFDVANTPTFSKTRLKHFKTLYIRDDPSVPLRPFLVIFFVIFWLSGIKWNTLSAFFSFFPKIIRSTIDTFPTFILTTFRIFIKVWIYNF